MILIEKDGQRQLVASTDGYSGWKVLDPNVPRPSSVPGRAVDPLKAEIEALKARVADLESRRT